MIMKWGFMHFSPFESPVARNPDCRHPNGFQQQKIDGEKSTGDSKTGLDHRNWDMLPSFVMHNINRGGTRVNREKDEEGGNTSSTSLVTCDILGIAQTIDISITSVPEIRLGPILHRAEKLHWELRVLCNSVFSIFIVYRWTKALHRDAVMERGKQ